MERFGNHIEVRKQENAPSKELESTLAEIETLFTADEEKINEFISKRINLLESNADKKTELSVLSNSLHEGFISNQTGVRRSFMVEPMFLNDETLYKDFIDEFKHIKQLEYAKTSTPRELLFTVIQYTLQKYFGNMFANADTETKNREFYLDKSVMSDEPSDVISIKDFKGENMAVCAEKASASQNILSFVGLDSYILLSGNCNLSGENSNEAHVFNVAHTEKGYFIFDPTNPTIFTDAENKPTGVSAAVYPITLEDFRKLTKNEQVAVNHTDIQIDNEGNQMPKKSERIYGGARTQ